MSREKQLIERTQQALSMPPTQSVLAAELRGLGVEKGMTLIVHSAMSAVGWVPGGAQAIIEALQRAVGEAGTLVMPTHTGHLSDPARWQNPAVPEAWWEVIRAEMPAFDPDATPVYGMGTIPETFRRMKGVRRSMHPHVSFAAWGARADEVLAGHGENPEALGESLGENSPVGRVYAMDGDILLLGVGYENNTTLHLAEYRADFAPKGIDTHYASVMVEGVRQWVRYTDLEYDTEDYAALGAAFEADTGAVRVGQIGMSTARLMESKALVDYAVPWMERHRGNREG